MKPSEWLSEGEGALEGRLSSSWEGVSRSRLMSESILEIFSRKSSSSWMMIDGSVMRPILRPIASAVRGWSPVTITTFTPAVWRSAML